MGEIADMCQGVADLIAEGRLEAERQAEEANRRVEEEKRRVEEAERRAEEEKREADRRVEEEKRRVQEEKQRADEAIGLLKAAARNLAADSSAWTAARLGKLLGQPEEQVGEWLASAD